MDSIENFNKSRNRFEELFTEMFAESDRGCILIGASVLDDVLCAALKKRLGRTEHASKQAMEPLFAGMGPLSSFSARIKLAYCLGLVGQWEFEDLERIRKIRNKAAHEYTAKTFTDNEIIQMSQLLQGANHAVVAIQKHEATMDKSAPTVEEEKVNRQEQKVSKERLRFQMTVVFLAGRLDMQAIANKGLPSGLPNNSFQPTPTGAAEL